MENLITLDFLTLIAIYLSSEKLLSSSMILCIILDSSEIVVPNLSYETRSCLTGSTRSLFRLILIATERSSMNFNLIAGGSLFILGSKGQLGRGVDGLSAAPLKKIMKRITPRTVPWGEDPGREWRAENTFKKL